MHYIGNAVANKVIEGFDPELESEIKISEKLAEKNMTEREKFRRKRLKNNYSCEMVADELGVSCTTIRYYESGRGVSKKTEGKILGWQPVELSLDRFIQKYKLTQKQAAEIIGVNPSTLWAWRKGKYQTPPYAKKALIKWEKERIMKERSLENE